MDEIFARNGTDPAKWLDTVMPELQTAKGQDMFFNAQKSAAMTTVGQARSTSAKVMLEDTKDFHDKFNNLEDPTQRAEVTQLNPKWMQTGPTTLQWNKVLGYGRIQGDANDKKKEDQKINYETRLHKVMADYDAGKLTGSEKNVKSIIQLQQEATAAKDAGDNATYDDKINQAKLLLSTLPKDTKRSVTTGYDESGKMTVTDTEETAGPSMVGLGQVGPPTKGTQTVAQQKILKYENANALLNQLENKIDWKSVGPQGVIGEKLGDELLANFIPGTFSKERVQTRQLIRSFRETMLRELGDDRRFSASDREEVAQALPESGIFESPESAKAKMGIVRHILSDRVRNAAEIGGQPIPDSFKTKDELAASYKSTYSAIQKAAKDGRLTPEEAAQKASDAYNRTKKYLESAK